MDDILHIMINNPPVTVAVLLLSLWLFIRKCNGQFDGGEINKNDREYYEDCEENGRFVADINETFRFAKRFFRK